jgi:hypothetical protein
VLQLSVVAGDIVTNYEVGYSVHLSTAERYDRMNMVQQRGDGKKVIDNVERPQQITRKSTKQTKPLEYRTRSY